MRPSTVSWTAPSMQASGVGIEDPVTKAQFNKLQLEQAELSTKFSNNVLDSIKLFRLAEKEDIIRRLS